MGIVETLNPGDDTIQIQEKLSDQGSSPSELHFNAGEYLIDNQLRFYSNTTVTADQDTVFILAPDLPLCVFGEQVPVFGQAESTISGLDISGFSFRGNYQTQRYTPGDHGKGFGNCFGFTNISNSYFHDLNLGENEGDEFRITGGQGLEFARIQSEQGGHDVIHLHECKGVKVQGCTIKMRSNNFVRVRGSSDVEILDNIVEGTTEAYAPPIQLEAVEAGAVMENIRIQGNRVSYPFGPGVWGIARSPASIPKDIFIQGNEFTGCGQMPGINKISGVGGLVIDGITGVNISSNIFQDCKGYGIMFGSYLGSSAFKGLRAYITYNEISGTRKSYYAGTASGTAIANLSRGRYTVKVRNNTLKNNTRNYYKVSP